MLNVHNIFTQRCSCPCREQALFKTSHNVVVVLQVTRECLANFTHCRSETPPEEEITDELTANVRVLRLQSPVLESNAHGTGWRETDLVGVRPLSERVPKLRLVRQLLCLARRVPLDGTPVEAGRRGEIRVDHIGPLV